MPETDAITQPGFPLGIKKIEVEKPKEQSKIYPCVEQLTFHAIIKSEEHGYELLKCIQAVVNEIGEDFIINSVRAIEKDPSILAKAQKYLPYFKMLP